MRADDKSSDSQLSERRRKITRPAPQNTLQTKISEAERYETRNFALIPSDKSAASFSAASARNWCRRAGRTPKYRSKPASTERNQKLRATNSSAPDSEL